MNEAWRLDEVDGLLLVRAPLLLALPQVAHVFSTRRADGRGDFDLGAAGDPDPLLVERRQRLLRAAGLSGTRPLLLRQVHGAQVVSSHRAWQEVPEADAAFYLADVGLPAPPAVRSADCVPILLAERSGRGGAAVHAGWRGTAAGVVVRAVEALCAAGIAPEALVAALGPAIRPCCYEVGPEVLAAVERASGRSCGEGARLDLHLANRAQLEAAGVPAGSIEVAPWCTHCRADLFFSHRRDGAGTGRMLSALGPRP